MMGDALQYRVRVAVDQGYPIFDYHLRGLRMTIQTRTGGPSGTMPVAPLIDALPDDARLETLWCCHEPSGAVVWANIVNMQFCALIARDVLGAALVRWGAPIPGEWPAAVRDVDIAYAGRFTIRRAEWTVVEGGDGELFLTADQVASRMATDQLGPVIQEARPVTYCHNEDLALLMDALGIGH
jgi:hypothetical protein